MLPVLHLDPVRRTAATVAALSALADNPLQAELAGLPEQVRADLALLVIADEDAFGPSRQESGQVIPAQMQRQLAQIIAIERQDVEGVELHLVVVPAGMQAVEVGDAVDAKQHCLAVDDEGAGARFFSAASTISG